MNAAQREDAHTLALLEAVDEERDISQRRLALRLDVALGLANSYLKRCVRKGWVKVSQAPGNRYLYYLTPKGFAEKSRLTARYLSVSMSFYRKAGHSCLAAFDVCRRQGWKELALVGISDLAEIALMCSAKKGITIVAFVDLRKAPLARHLDMPVFAAPAEVPNCDAWLITDLDDPVATKKHLWRSVEKSRVIMPGILERRPD
jgi:DNA-binding MarR family transcriptional regulator